MNPFRHILFAQQPLDIFRERKERMRLVAFAPLLALLIVFCFSFGIYPSLWPAIGSNLRLIGFSVFAAVIWLIAISNLQRKRAIEKIYGIPSTWFRFLFDLPMLLACLLWSLWCFYICGAFEKGFLLNLYVLIVYSSSRMVKVPFYALGTTAVGISLCLLTVEYWNYILPIPRPQAFNLSAVLGTFLSLYLGLYFIAIQEWLVAFIKKAFRIMALLLERVHQDEDS